MHITLAMAGSMSFQGDVIGRVATHRCHHAFTEEPGDILAVDRVFPVLCVLSLVLPFGLGRGIGGTRIDGVTALLWAGLVRITLLHHVTWSVNSPSAAVIRLLERPGWVYDVRRSTPARVAARRA
ncbi:hypothetical protein ACWCQN_03775 [Streptomyces sp. NPDC001984]